MDKTVEHRHETIRRNNRIWDDSNKRPLSSSISLFSRGVPPTRPAYTEKLAMRDGSLCVLSLSLSRVRTLTRAYPHDGGS